MSLLSCRGLRVEVGGQTLCHDLDLDMKPGQRWGLLGPNGCGKTLLLHTLAGLRPPAGGRIELDGCLLDSLRRRAVARRLGILFQELSPALPATVLETVLTGRHPHLDPWLWEQAADYQRARSALGKVGLTGFEQRDLASLSGGERQRAAIATLLVQAPGIYLLDEPTNHLDLRHQIRMLDLFGRLADQGAALLMSLHEVNLALRFCDHLVLLGDDGTRVGPVEMLATEESLSRLYGHRLRSVSGLAHPLMVPD